MELSTQGQREWAERIARWRKSKLGQDEFAAQEGVTANRLKWWDWKLRKLGVIPPSEGRPQAAAPQFVRLLDAAATSAPTMQLQQHLELVLSGGRMLRIPVGFDEATLSRLMGLLGGGAA